MKYDAKTIQRYLFTNEGIARCFLKDIMSMREDNSKELPGVWWLGQVPCYVVLVVAIVVGLQTTNKSTIFFLDDGSAVVACFLQHVYDPLTEEEKKEQVEAIRNRRELPERIGHPPESISIPEIGSVVKVTGKVQKWRKEERSIRIDDIVECGHMEEPMHWNATVELHRNKYSKPFHLPDRFRPPTTPPKLQRFPSPPEVTHEEVTYAGPSLSSPQTTYSALPSSPPKPSKYALLKHPSKLRRSELSIYILQTYIQEFMHCLHSEDASVGDGVPRGFTLRYLLKVPALRVLAKRILVQELKAAEKRRREKENGLREGSSKKSHPQQQPSDRKIKRLFEEAIRGLCQNGSLVQHEGAAYLWNASEAARIRELSWVRPGEEDPTLGSRLGYDVPSVEEEEMWIPVTNELLAGPILEATRLTFRRRLIQASRNKEGKVRGVTAEEILQTMKAKDERWERIYDIRDALHALMAEERISQVDTTLWVI